MHAAETLSNVVCTRSTFDSIDASANVGTYSKSIAPKTIKPTSPPVVLSEPNVLF